MFRIKSLFPTPPAWAAAGAPLFAVAALAAHPGPEPRPGPSQQVVSGDGGTTFVFTPFGLRPPVDNRLEPVDSNAFDGNGVEIPNTLPSRPGAPFNLHRGPVTITDIPRTSPREDLRRIFSAIKSAAGEGWVDDAAIVLGLDILEGNPVADRAYSGFPLLHYTGPLKLKRVVAERDASGRVIGGNVVVHQVWYDSHIESDTALIDPSEVQDVPWTVTYVVDVLDGGSDDFAPFAMLFDAPPEPGVFGPPHVAMDTSFFPMQEGKRHVVTIAQAPGAYWKITYTWGWRRHPPRVQAAENALQSADGLSLLAWETLTFGVDPRANEAKKLAAIAQIGDLAPAKRMWNALRAARNASPEGAAALAMEAQAALDDWSDRTRLPRGVQADPSADATLFYVNNTIYGNTRSFNGWDGRGAVFRAALLNGDHFVHGYVAVDFGGSRGWENQFVDAGGAGASHTFGRVHWWPVAGGPFGGIIIPPVSAEGEPGRHRVEIELNYDAPERLTLYQFDPMHHDVAVYSLH